MSIRYNRYKSSLILSLILLTIGVIIWQKFPFSQKHTTPPQSTFERVGDTNQRITSIPGLTVPDGFNISYFAQNVTGARSLARNPDGSIIYVGTRGDSLYAVTKTGTTTIRGDLNTPNGVAYKNGDLYVAEVSRILRFPKIDSTYATNPDYEIVYDQLPRDKHHGWKYIAFGPDGLLYIPIGAPCNVCEDQGRYSRLLTLDIKTNEIKTFATGVRNTVGFDWSPIDNTLYFTDNGRDLLGDDIPPDDLNHAPTAGLDFGFPRCHGQNIPDPKYGDSQACRSQTGPLVELDPHVAALGMKFYRGNMFPTGYKNQILIAEHGSWNRRDPIGYRLTLVDPVTKSYEPLVTGWLQNGKSWGRPVDILELPDGSVLISDDLNHSIYRLSYTALQTHNNL